MTKKLCMSSKIKTSHSDETMNGVTVGMGVLVSNLSCPVLLCVPIFSSTNTLTGYFSEPRL